MSLGLTGRWLLLALLLLPGTGCRLLKTAVDVPVRTVTSGGKDKQGTDPVEIQQKLLRFADEFAAQMIAGIDKLRRGTNVIEPDELLQWKIIIVTETCAIASGPNSVANLLDMTIFVTATRIALEVHWQPKVYGASALPMLAISRALETNIWRLAGTVLKTEQQEELRHAIAAWRELHPIPQKVVGARAVGLATEVARLKKTETAGSESVFGLLGLDPLSGLDPATRELALTRMFAERALFVTQWMPSLLRWQIELLSENAMEMPEVHQLINNSSQLSAAVERFSRVAEQLPKQVSSERQEILKALESQEKGLSAMANEFRQSLTAGAQMSTSLNTTLTTFDALMKRFGVGEPKPAGPPATNSAPFRILDYAQTATQVAGMAQQLAELLVAVNQTVGATNIAKLEAQLAPMVQQAQLGGKAVVDHAFRRAILFVVIVCTVVLVAALLYRFLSARMATTHSK